MRWDMSRTPTEPGREREIDEDRAGSVAEAQPSDGVGFAALRVSLERRLVDRRTYKDRRSGTRPSGGASRASRPCMKPGVRQVESGSRRTGGILSAQASLLHRPRSVLPAATRCRARRLSWTCAGEVLPWLGVDICREPYPSDVSDDEQVLVAPYLRLLPEAAGQRERPLREVFNGLRHVVKTGAPWSRMPDHLPPQARAGGK